MRPVSLDQAKELAATGYPQDGSEFLYVSVDGSEPVLQKRDEVAFLEETALHLAAPITEELMEWMPFHGGREGTEALPFESRRSMKPSGLSGDKLWSVGYGAHVFESQCLLDALVECAKWVLANAEAGAVPAASVTPPAAPHGS